MKNNGLFCSLFIEDLKDNIKLDDAALGRMATLAHAWRNYSDAAENELWKSFFKPALSYLEFVPANQPLAPGVYPLYEDYSFAKSISRDLIRKGITINNVCPGYFRTDRITELMEKESHDANVSPQEYEQEVMSSFPHKRFMSPDELGDMVAYLCSAQARSITGTTIQIDGGVNSGLF